MAQPSVASFFNTRKRAAVEDTITLKNRRLVEPAAISTDNAASSGSETLQDDEIATIKANMRTTRSGRTVKRIGVQSTEFSEILPKKMPKKDNSSTKQQKLVQFIKKGPLSPQKAPSSSRNRDYAQTELSSPVKQQQLPPEELQKINEQTPSQQLTTKLKNAVDASNAQNMEQGMKTPTKQIIKSTTPMKHDELKSMVKKELNFDEVKTKISRSAKLQELKASLARIQELEKTRKAQEEHNRRLREGLNASPAKKTPVVQLKEFDKIELEVLTSPAKTFKTPTKLPPKTPDKNELMSPRHTDVSKRVLFSPSKNGSPSKLITPPAYQRFMSLAENSVAGKLQLPYKYRYLLEIFKALDSVCAMFHNRKECITFKKLKPAVQRMLRKNFTETHLAQIKYLYPEAFLFTQMKMRNYGSASKADYFQLVIAPNVENLQDKQKLNKIDENDVLGSANSTAMNPLVMTERMQRFQSLLLERVKHEHDKFLKTLDPPLVVAKEKVTRWHPDFSLENCTEIEQAHLPQPPNVEKYSSARDILSTARNLFNCATPLERAMERYEAKLEADRVATENKRNADSQSQTDLMKSNENSIGNISEDTKPSTAIAASTAKLADKSAQESASSIPAPAPDITASNLLKGVPKSLLEKIRAKQAAKALDAITRRPSQDQEATKYSRLPELARHLRNVFITERKGVLTLEIVIKKIQNSFRTSLTPQEIEAHLKLMEKEVPEWIAFHEVRKTMYLKMAKDLDMNKIFKRLETVANEKSK